MCADNFSEERSLILRLIEGDEDAFCELYATYKNRLIYFAMRFLKSREYAEDVFQDVFTVVWQSRRFINPDLAANDKRLKGLKGVEYYQEGGLCKYTYGASTDYNKVLRTKREIAPKFKDAFIIAFKNGKKTSVSAAIEEFKKKRNK